MDKKRILFLLSHPFNPQHGGVQRTTYKLGIHFSKHGYIVGYYSLATHQHISPEFGTLFFPEEKLKHEGREVIKNHFFSKVNDFRPDIVINQMPYEKFFQETLKQLEPKRNFLLIGCLRNSLFSFKSNAQDIIKRRTPKPFHGILQTRIILSGIQQNHKIKHGKELRKILGLHDKFVLLTNGNLEELKFFIPEPPLNKIISIPNSIPKVLPDLPKKEKVVLFVGNLNIHQKRADLLLPIWSKVYKKLPEWRFIIVGDGDHRNAMEAFVKEEKLERVEFIGRANPDAFYEKASVFIMPSAFEGFPNVLIEAQSFGVVPVVFDSYLSLKSIVNDKQDAVLVKPNDLDGMAMEILKICLDTDIHESMAKKALANARKYTIDKVGELWFNFFNQSLQSKSSTIII